MMYFRYRHTNCFFVQSSGNGRLLAVDAGWPCTLYEYAGEMKKIGCRFEDVAWAMVTHFHMDHAGLVGEFVDRGIRCVVFENQTDTADAMEKTIRKNYSDYRLIAQSSLEQVDSNDSKQFFQGIGIDGQVVVTDYHSPDSVTFITGAGEAIVGDLPPQGQMMPDDVRFAKNWKTIWNAGGRTAYPSHAEVFSLSDPT